MCDAHTSSAGSRNATAFGSLSQIVFAAAAAVLLAGCRTPGPAGPPAESVYFPPPPSPARIQFLTTLSGEDDFAKPRSGLLTFLLGPDETKYRVVGQPYGVAWNDGAVHVVDAMARCIATFDLANDELRVFGTSGDGQLRGPVNIRRGPEGHLFVADQSRGQVVEFTSDGRYVRAFGEAGAMQPSDVAPTADRLYVADSRGHQVHVYSRDTGERLQSIGKEGKEPGQFKYPTNLALGPDGRLYVTDTLNFRVQIFEPDGTLVRTFGEAGRTLGTFSRPKGVAVDREGTIYVADAMQNAVQLYNPEGEVLMHFGGAGTAAARLFLPAQVSISYEGLEYFREYIAADFKAEYLLFVSNQYGPNKVSVYAYGRREAAR